MPSYRSLASLVTLLLAASLSSGCLTLMGGEERAGAEAAREAEAQMGIVNDPELEAYVRTIGERLVVNASRQDVTWRFKIIDMPEPNAFALPGGYVYVSRGLLALVNDEDELAGVIGHEIGHVTGRHGGKRVTLAAPFAVISGITGWATGLVSPTLGDAVAGAGDALAQGLVIAPYSRQQERDADRIGAELSAKAGWNPSALGDFLETLGKYETLETGKERKAGWFDTHPASPERAAETRKLAETLEAAAPNPVARDRADLFSRLDGLILGQDPAAGVVIDGRFIHPELGFTIAFPPTWPLANTSSAVASQEPEGQAVLVLQLVPEVDNLADVITDVEINGPRDLEITSTSVNGNPAARTQARQKGYLLDVTWIEHHSRVYQIVGITEARNHAAWQETFSKSINSFRNPQAPELAKVRASRLRIATARTDEDLPALLRRVGSFWEPERATVANGLGDGALEKGRLVKVGQDEPFRR
jgi:predicted Zn-dependent protease